MTSSALRADFALAAFALAAFALAAFALAAVARAEFPRRGFARENCALDVALTAAVTGPTAAEVERALPAESAEVTVTSIRCLRSAATRR